MFFDGGGSVSDFAGVSFRFIDTFYFKFDISDRGVIVFKGFFNEVGVAITELFDKKSIFDTYNYMTMISRDE